MPEAYFCLHGKIWAVDDVEFTEGMIEIYDEMPEEMEEIQTMPVCVNADNDQAVLGFIHITVSACWCMQMMRYYLYCLRTGSSKQ